MNFRTSVKWIKTKSCIPPHRVTHPEKFIELFRPTPPDIISLIGMISKKLDDSGFLLRSGGADGADSAFEKFSTNKEIYLPWDGFNGHNHDGVSYFDYLQCPGWSVAKQSVDTFHPNPKNFQV